MKLFSIFDAVYFVCQNINCFEKNFLFLLFACSFSLVSHAQIMVSKLISKGDSRFGLGYGLFVYYDYQLRHENQSIRIELAELAAYPIKGENLFTSDLDVKGYLSAKLGYKYVFSETQGGFYLLPSVGYCRVAFATGGPDDATYGDGIAAALEAGHTWEVGQGNNTINLGLKYEYDRGNATHILQSIGLRFSFGFGLGRRRD